MRERRLHSLLPTVLLAVALSQALPEAAFSQPRPVSESDEQETQRAYVCCRRLRGFFGVISFQRHCFLLITPDLSERGESYALHKRGFGGVPEENELSDVVGDRGSCTLVKESDTDQARVQQLVRLARYLQRNPDDPICRTCGSGYRMIRRNSNTYVSDLLRQVGFQPPRRWCAPGYRRK